MNANEYINALNTEYQTGNAREHSYRPALKTFIERFSDKIRCLNVR